ncbi:unnamed protein product [Ambrosiozyma monospora]|uniref:Unnamed protein product n=1 Tax=Ambrosiozyma monospora TaxID=43982 RepID=A0ACB5UCX5_AMBMO|nr:unnamed protein product [Ambrosiozyma monospora]
MSNLVELKTQIPEYWSVDLRHVKFPPRLNFFELGIGCGDIDFEEMLSGSDPIKAGTPYIVMHGFTVSLENIHLLVDRHVIFVDGSKGENFESMKRQISGVSPRCEWAHYSRFDEGNSILDSSRTLFVV